MASQKQTPPRTLSPEVPVVSYPTPNVSDLLVVQDVDTRTPDYVALSYGDLHPDQISFPGLKLVFQQPLDNEQNYMWVRRVYANDRSNQDTYNYAIKQTSSDPNFPIYIRTYSIPRSGYTPLPKGSVDPLFPTAPSGNSVVLNSEDVDRFKDDQDDSQLDSEYVKVTRTYITLPGPILTGGKVDPRYGIPVTVQRQAVPAGVGPSIVQNGDGSVSSSDIDPVDTTQSTRISSILQALPADQVWYGTRMVSGLPPVLVSAEIVGTEQLAFVPHFQECPDGPLVARYTRKFSFGPPNDEPTLNHLLSPQTFNAVIEYVTTRVVDDVRSSTQSGTDTRNSSTTSTQNSSSTGTSNETGNSSSNSTSNSTSNGTSNSTQNATSNGTNNSTSNSTSNGTSNSTQNATSNGTNNSTSNSTSNGTSNSTQNATSNGTSNRTMNLTSNGTTNSTSNSTFSSTSSGSSNSTSNGTSNSTQNGTENRTENRTSNDTINSTDSSTSNRSDTTVSHDGYGAVLTSDPAKSSVSSSSGNSTSSRTGSGSSSGTSSGTHSGTSSSTHSDSSSGTHSSADSATRSDTSSGTHSSTESSTHSLTESGTHSDTSSSTHSNTDSATRSDTTSGTRSETSSGTHSSTDSATRSDVYSTTHSGTSSSSRSEISSGTSQSVSSSTGTSTSQSQSQSTGKSLLSIQLPKCLRSSLTIVNDSLTATAYPDGPSASSISVSIPATSPTNLPYNSWYELGRTSEHWSYGVWVTELVEVWLQPS